MSSPEEDQLIIDQYLGDAGEHTAQFHELAILHGEAYAQKWAVTHDFPPPCPYCGQPKPYGFEREPWVRKHLQNRWHQIWWRLRGGPR